MERRKILEGLSESFQQIKRHMFSAHKVGHRHHITPAQWMMLKIIDHQKKISLKDLAQHLCISSSASTQMIDGLVKEGYVMRKENPEDRRSVVLSLSKKAQTKMTLLKKEAFGKMEELFEALTDKELETYLKLNQKIIQHTSSN